METFQTGVSNFKFHNDYLRPTTAEFTQNPLFRHLPITAPDVLTLRLPANVIKSTV
jgi:hypothetical protein